MKRLTIGMRARFKPDSRYAKEYGCEAGGNEVLLQERSSGGDFSVMILGQKELKKKDSTTVDNQLAWVEEDALEFVDADFETNLDFMDWYQANEDNFCGDCGVWRPWEDLEDPHAEFEETLCPNEKCPGRKMDSGHCPYCHPDVKLDENDKCPECKAQY